MLLLSSIGIHAYRDLSRPDAWDYWKDQYVSPSLTSSVIPKLDLDGAAQGRRTLFIKGEIGPAAAKWFRERLDEAQLAAGDVILMSSPGGDLNQAAIMGEIIRSRGLVTAVGIADAVGPASNPLIAPAPACWSMPAARPASACRARASACIGSPPRRRSMIPSPKPRRSSGAVLGYMTKMGVSASIVQAMSETKDIRWLAPKEALAMNLITDPIAKR